MFNSRTWFGLVMNNLFDPNEYDQYIYGRKFNQSQNKM